MILTSHVIAINTERDQLSIFTLCMNILRGILFETAPGFKREGSSPVSTATYDTLTCCAKPTEEMMDERLGLFLIYALSSLSPLAPRHPTKHIVLLALPGISKTIACFLNRFDDSIIRLPCNGSTLSIVPIDLY